MADKEELTTLMHSEFQVDEETEIKHRAMNIWYYGNYKTFDEIRNACKEYGITFGDALRYRDYWMELKAKSIKK